MVTAVVGVLAALDSVGCRHVPMHDDPELVASVILGTTGVAPA